MYIMHVIYMFIPYADRRRTRLGYKETWQYLKRPFFAERSAPQSARFSDVNSLQGRTNLAGSLSGKGLKLFG
jgi:hypothetical protein